MQMKGVEWVLSMRLTLELTTISKCCHRWPMQVFASMGADRNWKVKNSSYTTVQHKKLICVILDPRKSNIHWTGRNRSEPIGMMMRKKIMQTPFNRWTDMILDLYFSSWKNHRWWKNAISSIKIKYLWKSNIFGGSESQFSLKSGKSWNNVPTDSQCMGLDGVGETKASDSSEVRTHNFLLRQQRINSTVRGKLRILERIILVHFDKFWWVTRISSFLIKTVWQRVFQVETGRRGRENW